MIIKKWTEISAISIITRNGGEISGKLIRAKYGFKGLAACSALDYLVNFCGFKANI